MKRFITGLLLLAFAVPSWGGVDHKNFREDPDFFVLECLGLTSNAIMTDAYVWIGIDKKPTPLGYVLKSRDLTWKVHMLDESPREYTLYTQVRGLMIPLGQDPVIIDRQSQIGSIAGNRYECSLSSLEEIDEWVSKNVAPAKF